MKKLQKKLLIGAVVFVAIVLSFILLKNAGGFSILGTTLGEEGYLPYDTLLASGTFNQAKWIYTQNSLKCIYGITTCYGGGINQCKSTQTPFINVAASTANKGQITIKPDGSYGNAGTATIRTNDLRLKNYRMEVYYGPTRCSSNSYLVGGFEFHTNKGVIYSQATAQGQPNPNPFAVELTWDDYSLGHYQIKLNGVVVQDGFVGENDTLYFETQPKQPSCGDECTSSVTFANPRVKELFGCDEQGGEYLASMTFKGYTTLNINNLQGFKRFCVDHPSIYMNNGVSGSSKQVLYDLAGGKTIPIQNGEIRKIYYIADGATLGITQACTAGAFDINANKCDAQTGIVDICPAGAVKVNNTCVTFVEDKLDIVKNTNKVINNTIISWSNDGTDNSLRSGNTILLYNDAPSYNCQSKDGHNEYDGIIYPKPDATCWGLNENGKQITTSYKDAFFDDTVSFQGEIRYYYDKYETYHNGDFRDERDWNYNHMTKITNNFIQINGGQPNSSLVSGDSSEQTLTINNNFGKPLQVRVGVTYTPEIIETSQTYTKDITLPAGQTQMTITLPTGYVGKTSYEAIVVMKTSAGDVPASNVFQGAYDVEQKTVNNTVYKEVTKIEVQQIIVPQIQETTVYKEILKDNTDYILIIIVGVAVLIIVGIYLWRKFK